MSAFGGKADIVISECLMMWTAPPSARECHECGRCCANDHELGVDAAGQVEAPRFGGAKDVVLARSLTLAMAITRRVSYPYSSEISAWEASGRF